MPVLLGILCIAKARNWLTGLVFLQQTFQQGAGNSAPSETGAVTHLAQAAPISPSPMNITAQQKVILSSMLLPLLCAFCLSAQGCLYVELFTSLWQGSLSLAE